MTSLSKNNNDNANTMYRNNRDTHTCAHIQKSM